MVGETYSCDRCDATVSCNTHEAFYKLASSAELFVQSTPAWCNACNTLRRVELLPQSDVFVNRLASLESDGLSARDLEFVTMFDRDPASHLTKLVTETKAAIDWRAARTSPPRCMTCGSTDASALPLDADDELLPFPHRSCGGTFAFASGSFGSSRMFFLDAEGRRLDGKSPVT